MMKRNLRLQNQLRIAISDPRCCREVRSHQHLKDMCFDTDYLWPLVEFSAKLLEPIRNAIKEVEGNLVRVSVLPRLWRYIEHCVENSLRETNCPLTKDEADLLRAAIRERREFSVRSTQMAANLLDPRFCGDYSDEVEHAQAIKEIVKIAEMLGVTNDLVMKDFIAFKSRDGPVYSNELYWSMIEDETDPLQWWNTFCGHRVLAPVAKQLLSLPASVACVERSNKEYGMQKTKKRNRLTNDRSAKLTKVSYNIKVRHFANKRKADQKQHQALTVPDLIEVGTEPAIVDADDTTNKEDDEEQVVEFDQDVGSCSEEDDNDNVEMVEETIEVVTWVCVEYMIQNQRSRRGVVRLYYGCVQFIEGDQITVKFLKKVRDIYI